jgi:hypothetical protein
MAQSPYPDDRSLDELPLRHPCWRPCLAVCKDLAEHDGDFDLAAHDLIRAMAAGEVHSLWRRLADDVRGHMRPEWWSE